MSSHPQHIFPDYVQSPSKIKFFLLCLLCTIKFLRFKIRVIDPSEVLSKLDCCQWTEVKCANITFTGRVIELNLPCHTNNPKQMIFKSIQYNSMDMIVRNLMTC